MIRLPNKSLVYLTIACGVVFATYIAFLIATVCFASVQVARAKEVRKAESSVVALETKYYAAVQAFSKTDPKAAGFVTPKQVVYVTGAGVPTFSRADR